MLEINGSKLEGGGQILRTSLALSAILQKPFRIHSIRANRKEPGLKAQHKTGVDAMARLCEASVEGSEIGSTQVSFSPGKLKSGEFSFEIGTAGSITLLLQTLLPALAFAPGECKLKLTGGTHVQWSPAWEYFEHVLVPTLEKMSYAVSAKCIKPGFYPKGGGEAEVMTQPARELKALELASGVDSFNVSGVSLSSSLPAGIAERQAAAVKKILPEAKIQVQLARSASPGTAVCLWAAGEHCFLGASSLGAIGKPAERVGGEAALCMKREIDAGACVDAHLADQLMVYAALAHGKSTFKTSEITLHAKTNAWLIKQFTEEEFALDEPEHLLSVQGAGFKNEF